MATLIGPYSTRLPRLCVLPVMVLIALLAGHAESIHLHALAVAGVHSGAAIGLLCQRMTRREHASNQQNHNEEVFHVHGPINPHPFVYICL
jgi:hypothetical protein